MCDGYISDYLSKVKPRSSYSFTKLDRMQVLNVYITARAQRHDSGLGEARSEL
jgi:hypothetical protein